MKFFIEIPTYPGQWRRCFAFWPTPIGFLDGKRMWVFLESYERMNEEGHDPLRWEMRFQRRPIPPASDVLPYRVWKTGDLT